MTRWPIWIAVVLCACSRSPDAPQDIREIRERRLVLERLQGQDLADSLRALLAEGVIVDRPGSPDVASSLEDALAVWLTWDAEHPDLMRRPDQIHADGSLGVEYGRMVPRRPSSRRRRLAYVTHWARNASGVWHVTYDAVIDPGTRTTPTPGRGSMDVPGDTTGTPGTGGAISVEETVTSARRGDYQVTATIRQAADDCGAGPDSWQWELMARLVAEPVDSFTANGLTYAVPAMAAGMLRCPGIDVGRWIRAVLYSDVPQYAYIPILKGLVDGAGYLTVSAVAEDTIADPNHRLWATQAILDSYDSGLAAPPIAPLPSALAEHYRFNGLPAIYVETWLPMLLAAIETREATAEMLIRAVGRRPEMEGAADIVRILGADVGAYDYRFSDLTRSIVASVLDDLSARTDLPAAVTEAVRQTLDARAGHRNHQGGPVSQRSLSITYERVGDVCRPVWPRGVGEAVEAVAPGFHIDAPRGCDGGLAQFADFDGDGAQDTILKGLAGEGTILLAVLTGDRPRAFVVERMGPNDYGVVVPPGTFMPLCDGFETYVFPNDYISVSYDEKSSANFRFDGETFEKLTGDTC